MSTENSGGIQYEMKDLEKMKRTCLCNLVLRMQDEMQQLLLEKELSAVQNDFQKQQIVQLVNEEDNLKMQVASLSAELQQLKSQSACQLNKQQQQSAVERPRPPLLTLQHPIIESDEEAITDSPPLKPTYIKNYSGKDSLERSEIVDTERIEAQTSLEEETKTPDNFSEMQKQESGSQKQCQQNYSQKHEKPTTLRLKTNFYYGTMSKIEIDKSYQRRFIVQKEPIQSSRIIRNKQIDSKSKEMLLKSIHQGSFALNHDLALSCGYSSQQILSNGLFFPSKEKPNNPSFFNSIIVDHNNTQHSLTPEASKDKTPPRFDRKSLLKPLTPYSKNQKHPLQKAIVNSNFKDLFLNQQGNNNNNNNDDNSTNDENQDPEVLRQEEIQGIQPNQQQQPEPISYPVGSRSFQGFFILGPSLSAMSEIVSKQEFNGSGVVPPDTYLTFPSQQPEGEEAQRCSLAKHCFPYNITFTRHYVPLLKNGEVDDILNLQIFKHHTVQHGHHSFVIRMLGDQNGISYQNNSGENQNQTLTQVNKSHALYSICYTVNNYFTLPEDQNSSSQSTPNVIYIAPTTFCFMTYYPFIDFFLEVIHEIADSFQLSRKQQYLSIYAAAARAINSCTFCAQLQVKQQSQSALLESTNNHRNSNVSSKKSPRKSSYEANKSGCSECVGKELLKMLDLGALNDVRNFFSEEMQPIRAALEKLQVTMPIAEHNLEFSLQFSKREIHKVFAIPSLERLSYIEAEWGAYLTFSCLSLEDFLFVLTAVSLEQKVIFFSSNSALLTSALLTFLALLKPIDYPFSTVFTLPEDIQDLLDSFIPNLLGINKNIAYLQELEEVEGYDFSDKVVIDLDAGTTFCSNEISIYLKKNMPLFKSSQPELATNYFLINNAPSSQHTHFNNIRKKSLTKSSPAPLCSSSPKLRIQFEPTSEQNKAMKTIVGIIRMSFEKYFLSTLPRSDKVLSDSLDLDKIRRTVVKKSQTDKKFIEEYVQTQSFTSFSEEHYCAHEI